MIQIQNLNYYYSKKNPLFKNLDLDLSSGKIYGLLGKNGTGKSTLLKLILGALFPKKGIIKIDQVESRSRKADTLSEIFILTEEYELPNIKINSFVNAKKGFYPKFDKENFNQLLEGFEIKGNGLIGNLSYGQKKKVLIAFALSTKCKYILLDEPTNGLDIPSKSQFRKAILNSFDEDQTIIISTHQIRDLNQLLESIIIIENGEIILNKDILELENKLQFSKTLIEQDIPENTYSEQVVGGYMYLSENVTGEPSDIDLELLFNAVISDNQNLQNLL